MAIDTLGLPTIVPPTNNGTEPRMIPTNAGVFQTEIAADFVTQQAQQVQVSSSRAATPEQQQASSEPAQSEQEAAPQRESTADPAHSPSQGRGENVNIQV
ncbi:MAG: hypothetical protein ACKVHL_05905 [Rhodospirillales bacterium]|jgi:hypothetical protein